MKTTIQLPDEMLTRAKVAAARRKTTLRVLVMEGLEQVLATDADASPRERARKLFAAMDRLPGFTAQERFDRQQANAR